MDDTASFFACTTDPQVTPFSLCPRQWPTFCTFGVLGGYFISTTLSPTSGKSSSPWHNFLPPTYLLPFLSSMTMEWDNSTIATVHTFRTARHIIPNCCSIIICHRHWNQMNLTLRGALLPTVSMGNENYQRGGGTLVMSCRCFGNAFSIICFRPLLELRAFFLSFFIRPRERGCCCYSYSLMRGSFRYKYHGVRVRAGRGGGEGGSRGRAGVRGAIRRQTRRAPSAFFQGLGGGGFWRRVRVSSPAAVSCQFSAVRRQRRS